MEQVMWWLSFGFAFDNLALTVARVAVGAFFFLSGYHKLFNRERHAGLLKTLIEDKVPLPRFNQWWVPFWEFTGGFMVMIGLLTVFSASVLFIVCLVACACEARGKVASFKPIDTLDAIDDYLYLPEVLYLALLSVSIFAGPGQFSVDALIWR